MVFQCFPFSSCVRDRFRFLIAFINMMWGVTAVIIISGSLFIQHSNWKSLDPEVTIGVTRHVFFLGVAVLLLALIGCGGAHTSSRCLLLIYVGTIVVIAVLGAFVTSTCVHSVRNLHYIQDTMSSNKSSSDVAAIRHNINDLYCTSVLRPVEYSDVLTWFQKECYPRASARTVLQWEKDCRQNRSPPNELVNDCGVDAIGVIVEYSQNLIIMSATVTSVQMVILAILLVTCCVSPDYLREKFQEYGQRQGYAPIN